jgi:hypothetical protein
MFEKIELSKIKLFLDSKEPELKDFIYKEIKDIEKINDIWETKFNKNQKIAVYLLIHSVKEIIKRAYNVDLDLQKKKAIKCKKENIISFLCNPELNEYIKLVNEYYGRIKITSTTRVINNKIEHQNAIDVIASNEDDWYFIYIIFNYLYNRGNHRYNIDYWLGIAYPQNLHVHIEVNTHRGYHFIEVWVGNYDVNKLNLKQLITSKDKDFDLKLSQVERYYKQLSLKEYLKIFDLLEKVEKEEDINLFYPVLFSAGSFILTQNKDEKIKNSFYGFVLGLLVYFFLNQENKEKLKKELEKYEADSSFLEKIKKYLGINKLIKNF